MQAVSLLLIVILLGYVFKNEKSTYSRMIIGSIFGIVFFAIWPLALYFAHLYMLSEIYRISFYVGLSLMAISLSFILIKLDYNEFVAPLALALFVVINVITFSFDSNIKNFIAINSNYFSNSLPVTELNTRANRASHSNHNYTYTLTGDWNKKTDKGSVFEYYELYKDNVKQIELRPKCFAADKTIFTDIVDRLIKSIENREQTADTECYKTDQPNYACRINSLSNNNITRTRWLRIDTQLKYGMELDFVIFNQHTSNTSEINTIIQSALFNNSDPSDVNCLTLTEWI